MGTRIGAVTWFGLAVTALLLYVGHAQTSSGVNGSKTPWPASVPNNDSDVISMNDTERELPTLTPTTSDMSDPHPDTTTPSQLINATEQQADHDDSDVITIIKESPSTDSEPAGDSAESPILRHNDTLDIPSPSNATTVQSCPEFMCTMSCPAGYQKDAQGCLMCQCLPRPHGDCKGIGCPQNTVCHETGTTSVCKAMPLCLRQRAMLLQEMRNINTWPMLVRGSPQVNDGLPGLRHIPTCEKDGTFTPKQCSKNSTVAGDMYDCWCVYDRGVELPGSRHVVAHTNDTVCERKETRQLQVFFKMLHSYEQLEQQLQEFTEFLRRQLSEWTTIEYEHIEDLRVRPNSVDRVVVEFSITRHQHADLASVGFHFMHSVHYRNLKMHFKGTTFTPLPETLSVTHHYAGEQPQIAVCYFGPRDDRSPRKAVVDAMEALVCGAVVLMVGVVFVTIMARRKRASRDDDKEAFFGRNLFYTNMPSLIPTDEEKKEPIA